MSLSVAEVTASATYEQRLAIARLVHRHTIRGDQTGDQRPGRPGGDIGGTYLRNGQYLAANGNCPGAGHAGVGIKSIDNGGAAGASASEAATGRVATFTVADATPLPKSQMVRVSTIK